MENYEKSMDDLFDGLDSKMDFLTDTPTNTNNDGIYRIDMKLVKDKKRGYRSLVRLLPNYLTDGTVGQSAIEKISHYVKISDPKELSGYFDSPKNFKEKCALSDLYYAMTKSKNAVLIEKANKILNYSKKYYSYVLILEDEQQPELVGKIMIMQYGKQIKEKILAEKNGEITGKECNVFHLSQGKDLSLIVKEIQTGDETYPDYNMCMFKQDPTSLPVYDKVKGVFRNVPLDENGKISKAAYGKVAEFLLDRTHTLEDFGPKHLTDEQHAKITEISNFLTGKAVNTYNAQKVPTSEDFEFEATATATSKQNATIDDDDFFNGF